MKQELSRVKEPKRFDFILASIIVVMILTSLLSIYSSLKLVPASYGGYGLILKQLMWAVVGLVAIIVIMYFGNDALYDFIKIVYWILLVMLVVLFLDMMFWKITGRHFPGGLIEDINGAVSWYQIPGIGTFQPSEFMKIVLIVKTALIIDEHNKDKTEDTYESDLNLFYKIIKTCLVPVLLILLQPDTGICIIIFISIAIMTLCSGVRKEWFTIGMILILIVCALFFYLYLFQRPFLEQFIASYKLKRFDGWIYPEKNYIDEGHQLYTALLALGSAGLTGVGLQPDTIFIAEAHTDLIFVVFGQSFGLIGALFILILCFALDFKLYTITIQSKNPIEKYMICGFLAMMVYQQIQNMGMVVGLLPITGITLPFISYGGSSLLSYFIVIGLVMNASAKAKKLSDYVYSD